ncbi:MAG: succinate dehydrogenase, cytochrome b556 subunit [Proteobacteria bacterium]|nr:succinate dehydrogenase, cytochrome b556 subunit [Pseudomonadota bacterium]
MKAYQPKRHYRWHPGFIAWLLHRLSGACLAGYLLAHLWVLNHLAKGPAEFDYVMSLTRNPLVGLLEIGLLGVVAYHTINGLRVVLMDYGPMAEKETYVKYLAGTFAAIALVVVVGGGIMFVRLMSH